MTAATRRLSAKSRELHCPLCDRLLQADPETLLIPEHRESRGRGPRKVPTCEASGWHVEPHEWLWP